MTSLLKRIRAYGIHRRLSFDVAFYDDVNILYGRNGSGKTTLLHILANVLNGTFDRFAFLDFDQIEIDLRDDREITIRRRHRSDNEREVIEIFVDSNLWGEFAVAAVTTDPPSASTNPLDQVIGSGKKYLPDFNALLTLLGISGAAYFPAFRTMIEAWSPTQKAKEDLARQLCGSFAPSITYPSVYEIERDLPRRIGAAQHRIQTGTERNYSWLFFRALMPVRAPSDLPRESAHELLARIRQQVKRLDQSEIIAAPAFEREAILREIDTLSDEIRRNGVPEETFALLTIFSDTLAERLRLQESEFAPFARYFSSVNSFLEGKRLSIITSPEQDYPIVLVEFDDGTTGKLHVLSSGERHIVSMLYAASALKAVDVVLVDEPELSLHVDWQRRLLREMREQVGNRQIILCTHSPMIGAEYDDRYQEVGLAPTLAAAD